MLASVDFWQNIVVLWFLKQSNHFPYLKLSHLRPTNFNILKIAFWSIAFFKYPLKRVQMCFRLGSAEMYLLNRSDGYSAVTI